MRKPAESQSTKVYGEMTIGILVTAVVAVLGQITGAYYSFLMAHRHGGPHRLCVVQIAWPRCSACASPR